MTDRIRLFTVSMPDDLQPVIRTLRSGFVAEGPRVAEFERAITKFVGNQLSVALNSGTSSLHLALMLAGVKPGSKVITTPITSPATIVSIVNLGAQIVWADVDTETGDISPASVNTLMDRLGDEISAVLVVHWGGYPCDIDAIHEAVASRAYIIEDAAHALCAEYKGRAVGSISALTCFSFQAIKHITTGDGGLLCCREPADYDRARKLRWFGIDRARPERSSTVDIAESGYKFHMNDIAATLGLIQLEELPRTIERRREIAGVYESELSSLMFQRGSYDCRSSYWLFTMLVESRDEFIKSLDSRGVECSPVHRANHTYTAFANATLDSDSLEGVDYFDKRMVSIPVGQWLTDDDVAKVVAAIKKGW